MATTTRTLSASVSGTVYTTNLNAALEAIDTCHSGTTAPTDELVAGKLWLDTTTTPALLKVYDNGGWNLVYSGRGDLDVVGTLSATSLTGDGSGLTNVVTSSAPTGSGEMPSGTTAQRDVSPSAGYLRFNSTNVSFEGHNGSEWGAIGGGATGGGNDAVFYENGQTVTTSYAVTATTNAMTAGPITINAGATVTVDAGGRWIVL